MFRFVKQKKLVSHAVEGVKIESIVEYIERPDLEPSFSGPYLYESYWKIDPSQCFTISYSEYE